MTTISKSYEMPQVERLELEDLCGKVRPSESGTIITHFRELLSREPPVQEVPRILRSVILTTLQGRPKEETVSEWVTKRTKSLTSLKPHSTKIMPLGGDDDGYSRRESMPASAYLPHQRTDQMEENLRPGYYIPRQNNSDAYQPQQLSVDNLPRTRINVEDLPV